MGITAADFTAGQLAFIKRLAGATGLDAGVIAAWVYSEENGGAALSYERKGYFNWLNVGAFDSGFGSIYYDPTWQDPTKAADATAEFLQGKKWGASSGIQAILNTVSQPPSSQIGAIRTSGWASSGYPALASTYGSLDPAFLKQIAAGITTGGTAGLGGTGTTPNAPSSGAPFQVGDTSNPDEDYMTAASRLAASAYWYFFGDGETVYLADGTMLMQQSPAKVINLFRSDVLSWNGAFDNTAFQYAAHHKRRQRIQRRSTLAKIQSPVEMTIDLVCDIDELRAGDTVYVLGSGPGDGPWLVGDTYRSPFLIYTELTLVPAIAPIDAVAGVGATTTTGPAASRAGSGTVMAALLSMAATINNQDYPYVWGGGHAKAGTPDVGMPGGNGYDGHTIGFDCSGAVAAVLAAAGLVKAGSSVGNDSSLVAQLRASGYLVPGVGAGNPACTIYDNPGVHIFMALNGEAWGTADGAGNLPSTPRQGAGWIPHWGSGSFAAYHIPANVLGKPVL